MLQTKQDYILAYPQAQFRKIGDRVVLCKDGGRVTSEVNAIIFNGTTNAVSVAKDLGTKEAHTSFRNMNAWDFNYASGTRGILDSPTEHPFSSNLVLAREITNFHVALTVGGGNKVRLVWSNANRGAGVNYQWNVLHFHSENVGRVTPVEPTRKINGDTPFNK
jgi:hypothetical protein